MAAHNGRLPVVERLIAAGADVDKATTDFGRTPLIIAAINSHLPVAKRLVKAGAVVDTLAAEWMRRQTRTSLFSYSTPRGLAS